MVWAAPAGSSTLTEEMLLLSSVGMMVMESAAESFTASTASSTAVSPMTAVWVLPLVVTSCTITGESSLKVAEMVWSSVTFSKV